MASAEAFGTGWIKGTKIWQVVFLVAFVGYGVLAMFGSAKGTQVHAPATPG